jgi:hypothetical protein
MEFGILSAVIILLLLPIADVAAAAITYIRVDQAMRNVAAWAHYNPPPDITLPATWPNLPNNMSGFAVSAQAATSPPAASAPGSTISIYITVSCGDPPGPGKTPPACTPADRANYASVKWYSLSANVRLNPICPIFVCGTRPTGGVLTYSERF